MSVVKKIQDSSRQSEFPKEILRRLDTVIAVMLETGKRDGKPIPLAAKIRLLNQAGMRPIEISRILGRKPSHISKELTHLRREGQV